MFCDQCGAQLQGGAPRCARCGKPVLGLIELRRSRVREHVRLLGILWMAYSALYVIAGVSADPGPDDLRRRVPHFTTVRRPKLPPGCGRL